MGTHLQLTGAFSGLLLFAPFPVTLFFLRFFWPDQGNSLHGIGPGGSPATAEFPETPLQARRPPVASKYA
jgi:hypothetical protein